MGNKINIPINCKNSWFGHRDLEQEAKVMSFKMGQSGVKGIFIPNTASLLSEEELELTNKDRTPG